MSLREELEHFFRMATLSDSNWGNILLLVHHKHIRRLSHCSAPRNGVREDGVTLAVAETQMCVNTRFAPRGDSGLAPLINFAVDRRSDCTCSRDHYLIKTVNNTELFNDEISLLSALTTISSA